MVDLRAKLIALIRAWKRVENFTWSESPCFDITRLELRYTRIICNLPRHCQRNCTRRHNCTCNQSRTPIALIIHGKRVPSNSCNRCANFWKNVRVFTMIPGLDNVIVLCARFITIYIPTLLFLLGNGLTVTLHSLLSWYISYHGVYIRQIEIFS